MSSGNDDESKIVLPPPPPPPTAQITGNMKSTTTLPPPPPSPPTKSTYQDVQFQAGTDSSTIEQRLLNVLSGSHYQPIPGPPSDGDRDAIEAENKALEVLQIVLTASFENEDIKLKIDEIKLAAMQSAKLALQMFESDDFIVKEIDVGMQVRSALQILKLANLGFNAKEIHTSIGRGYTFDEDIIYVDELKNQILDLKSEIEAQARDSYYEEIQTFTKDIRTFVERVSKDSLSVLKLNKKHKEKITNVAVKDVVDDLINIDTSVKFDDKLNYAKDLREQLDKISFGDISQLSKDKVRDEYLRYKIQLTVDELISKDKRFNKLNPTDQFLIEFELITKLKADYIANKSTKSLSKLERELEIECQKEYKVQMDAIAKKLVVVEKNTDALLKKAKNAGMSITSKEVAYAIRHELYRSPSVNAGISSYDQLYTDEPLDQNDVITNKLMEKVEQVLKVQKMLEKEIKINYPKAKLDTAKKEYLNVIANEIVSKVKPAEGVDIKALIDIKDTQFLSFITEVVVEANQSNINYIESNTLAKGYLDEKIQGINKKFATLQSNQAHLPDPTSVATLPPPPQVKAPQLSASDAQLYTAASNIAAKIISARKMLFTFTTVLGEFKKKKIVDVFKVAGGGKDINTYLHEIKRMEGALIRLESKCHLSYDVMFDESFTKFVQYSISNDKDVKGLNDLIDSIPEKAVKNRRKFLKILVTASQIIDQSTQNKPDKKHSNESVSNALHEFGFIKKNILGQTRANYNDLDKYRAVMQVAAANPDLYNKIKEEIEHIKGKRGLLKNLNKVCGAMVSALEAKGENINSISELLIPENEATFLSADLKVVLEASNTDVAAHAASESIRGFREREYQQNNNRNILNKLNLRNENIINILGVLSAVAIDGDESKHLTAASIVSILSASENIEGVVIKETNGKLKADASLLKQILEKSPDKDKVAYKDNQR